MKEFTISPDNLPSVTPVGRDAALAIFASDKFRAHFNYTVAGQIDDYGTFDFLESMYAIDPDMTDAEIEGRAAHHYAENPDLNFTLRLMLNADRLYEVILAHLQRRTFAANQGMIMALHDVLGDGLDVDPGLIRGTGTHREEIALTEGRNPPPTAEPLKIQQDLRESLAGLSQFNTLVSSLGVLFTLTWVMPFWRLNRLLGLALAMGLLVDGGYAPLRLSESDCALLGDHLSEFVRTGDATAAIHFLAEILQRN